MELLVIGERPTEYLETVSCYLNQCGIYCNVVQTAVGTYTVRIDDYTRPPFEISCVCEELNPSNVIKKTEKLSADFKNATYVVNISNIKWLPEFQYNVDENWREVDQWISWEVYQKRIRSTFCSAKFGWVFSGAERISMCSQFFQDVENDIALHLSLQPLCGADIPALMQRFLIEIGEEKFLESINKSDDIAGFMFSPFFDASKNYISEKTNVYWILYSFLQSSGPDSQKLYYSLFE